MRMPSLFVGHGSPMIAIEDNEISRNFKKISKEIIDKYKKPKAILMISAHCYTKGSFIQNVENPKQIYDMYGFPKELYELKYEPKGSFELSSRIIQILGNNININNDWGIDHGAWSVLTHMFPKADIPIVQLSVDKNLSEIEMFNIGEKLSLLRDEGYLLIGSGNIVHNLAKVEWDNEFGTKMADEFDDFVKTNILNNKYDEIVYNIREHKYYRYAVCTREHFCPLIYILGASKKQKLQFLII